jgi:hypothetical protein
MLRKSEYGLFIGCHGNCDVAALFISRTFAGTTCADTPCRGSSVSIVSDYGLDERAFGVQSLAEAKDFFSSPCVQTGFGAHPASYPVDTGGPFDGAKARPGRDAHHSPHLVPRS